MVQSGSVLRARGELSVQHAPAPQADQAITFWIAAGPMSWAACN